MSTEKEVNSTLLALSEVEKSHPYGKDTAAYSFRNIMFALMLVGKSPVQLSLRCDPQLAKILRERYETIMEGYRLDKRHWNTVVLSGQLNQEEVGDLIRHAYEIAKIEADKADN